MSDRKRLLVDLRVVDLRAELEKRNLDKSGVRGVLIQRLTKYLEEEGNDPATYQFELNTSDVKTPAKKTRRSGSTVETDLEEAPTIEDMIVQDDTTEEDSEPQLPPKVDIKAKTKTERQIEEKMDTDNSDRISRKRDSKEVLEATAPKKPCLVKDDKNDDDDHKHENNIDTEDSINLDIGDDELLNEETDSTAKQKKDDAESNELAESTHGDDGEPPVAAADDQQQVKAETTTTSTDDDKNETNEKDEKDIDGTNDKKEKKDETKEGGARNLWVSGLSGDTRAKDLKQLCSKHGKVIGAKVVTNARTPGSRCYGYVTMASAQDADNCIRNLHRTELHGRMISVEKAKSESESSSRRQAPSRSERRSSAERKDDKGNEAEKENENLTGDVKVKKEEEVSGAESTRSTSNAREKSSRSEKDRQKRSTRSRERRKSPKEVLSFSKIWKERDVARARERSRAAREEERRRRAAEEALRERERRQRQEKHRLALEREKLRAEREKIEREKNELLRLERERHRLEREKLELERLELKRAQLRLEEERRKRGYESSAAYRKPAPSPPPSPYREPRHKRPPPAAARGGFDTAPPPPRFEPVPYDRASDKRDRERDYKREFPRHIAGNVKYPSNGNTNDDARQPIPPGTRPKEPGRVYESRENRSYRPSPPNKPEQRAWNSSSRYTEAAPASKGSGAGAEAWGGGASGGAERYAYEALYEPHYQPPPPGAAYPDRYPPHVSHAARDYRKY